MRIISLDIGIRNLSVCVLSNENQENQELEQPLAWSLLPLLDDDVKVKQTSLDQLSQTLYQRLDELCLLALKDQDKDQDKKLVILLENQPCMKAPLMKTIQVMIFSYFQMLRHVGQLDQLECSVHLVSAQIKTKAALHPFTLPETLLTAYKKRKWESVQYTKAYLNSPEFHFHSGRSIFESQKKKDDLADAFLQACAWLKSQKIVMPLQSFHMV